MQSTRATERKPNMQTLPKPCRATLLRRSQRQIRTNFYDKLGITGRKSKKRSSPGIACATNKSSLASEHTETDTSTSVPHHLVEPSHEAPKSCMKQVRPVLHPKPQHNVTFDNYMHVHLIPSHRNYNLQTKAVLWNSTRALKEERKRNELEFWAEGGNWRAAVEEPDMVRTRDGALIHPATWAYLQAFYQGYAGAYYEYPADKEEDWDEEYEQEEKQDRGEEEEKEDYAYHDAEYEGCFQTKPLPSYRSNAKPCQRNSWDKSARNNTRSVLAGGTDYYTSPTESSYHRRSDTAAIAA